MGTREEAGPEAFVADLRPAIRQSAAIARSLEGRVPNEPKDDEETAVKAALTVADTAAQEALLVPLLRRFADVELEAEEDTESVRRFSGRRAARIVIDPIDGTLRSYLHAQGPYAVLAGLAIDDVYRAALVALPREGVFLHAIEGRGAFQEDEEGAPVPVRAEADGREILVSYGLPQ
ncbi:MAG: hypothetical protein HKP30_14735, partial [Myxococcales bacterium]|nr:hypothetical protein [Myxococcales bacterium]